MSDAVPISNPFLRRFKRLFRDADQTSKDRLIKYFAWFPHNKVIGLFQNYIRSELNGYDPCQVMRETLLNYKGRDPLSKMLLLDTRYFLTDHNLN